MCNVPVKHIKYSVAVVINNSTGNDFPFYDPMYYGVYSYLDVFPRDLHRS